MTREEFAPIIGYLSAGCQKPISADAAEVYFDALGDLSAEVLRFAAKRTVMEHRYATFPSVAMIRDFATQAMRHGDMTDGEAWGLAWAAAKSIDPEMSGLYRVYRSGDGTFVQYTSQLEYECSKLPSMVLRAMQTFGIFELCQAEKPDVARAQFQAIYKALAEKDRRSELLPPDMRTDLARIRELFSSKIGVIAGP